MCEHDRVRHLLETLTKSLAELDAIDAPIAAAHLDSAILALCDQFGIERRASTMD